MMYWVLDGRDEADQVKTRSKLEIPPRGYTGSLAGTSWDPDVILEGYKQ